MAEILGGEASENEDYGEEMEVLTGWLTLERFDRPEVNRRVKRCVSINTQWLWAVQLCCQQMPS